MSNSDHSRLIIAVLGFDQDPDNIAVRMSVLHYLFAGEGSLS
jgi:hypothetical protein